MAAPTRPTADGESEPCGGLMIAALNRDHVDAAAAVGVWRPGWSDRTDWCATDRFANSAEPAPSTSIAIPPEARAPGGSGCEKLFELIRNVLRKNLGVVHDPRHRRARY